MPWCWVTLKGTRVLARCDASGALRADGGRVEVRYRPRDARSYRAAVGNLSMVAGSEVLPDEHCAEAEPAPQEQPARVGKRAPQARVAAGGVRAPDHGADTIVAYTDGACSGNPGPAGLGVVLCVGSARRELSEFLGHATNNVAELTAILRALEALDGGDEAVAVYTDSQYAIGVLQKGWKPKVNQALIEKTRVRMGNFTRLRLVYVKGHAGIPMNERADALARGAVSARSSSGWLELSSRDDPR